MSDDRQTGMPEQDRGSGRITRSAVEALQGEIILRKRWQRVVFIAGLIGIALVGVAVSWLASV